MKRSAQNIAQNDMLNSSRKMVIARQVSVMAYHARSYRCSTSASRRRPKKADLSMRPTSSVSARAALASTSEATLLVVSAMTVG